MELRALLPENINHYHEPYIEDWMLYFAVRDKVQEVTLYSSKMDLLNMYMIIAYEVEELIPLYEMYADYPREELSRIVRNYDPPQSFLNKQPESKRFFAEQTLIAYRRHIDIATENGYMSGKHDKPHLVTSENLRHTADALNGANFVYGVAGVVRRPWQFAENDMVVLHPPVKQATVGWVVSMLSALDQWNEMSVNWLVYLPYNEGILKNQFVQWRAVIFDLVPHPFMAVMNYPPTLCSEDYDMEEPISMSVKTKPRIQPRNKVYPIRFDPEMYEQFREIATKQNMPITRQLRIAMMKYVETHAHLLNQEEGK